MAILYPTRRAPWAVLLLALIIGITLPKTHVTDYSGDLLNSDFTQGKYSAETTQISDELIAYALP